MVGWRGVGRLWIGAFGKHAGRDNFLVQHTLDVVEIEGKMEPTHPSTIRIILGNRISIPR